MEEEEVVAERREYRHKLEEIAERVDDRRLVCDAMDFVLQRNDQDCEDLMSIVSVAYDAIDTFKEYAANIRHNNYDNRPEWEERAKTYENAANHLSHRLEEAADKL